MKKPNIQTHINRVEELAAKARANGHDVQFSIVFRKIEFSAAGKYMKFSYVSEKVIEYLDECCFILEGIAFNKK